ncbi:unnamed protein product, partial [marine sediment metagenome]
MGTKLEKTTNEKLKELVDAIEAKLDNDTHGLAALKALIDAVCGDVGVECNVSAERAAKLDNLDMANSALKTLIDAIKLKSDLMNSDSGSATITGTDSDTIVPSSLPTKMHLSLDINALVAAGADNTIEIKVGVGASERVVAYYNLVGDGADITADTGSG